MLSHDQTMDVIFEPVCHSKVDEMEQIFVLLSEQNILKFYIIMGAAEKMQGFQSVDLF